MFPLNPGGSKKTRLEVAELLCVCVRKRRRDDAEGVRDARVHRQRVDRKLLHAAAAPSGNPSATALVAAMVALLGAAAMAPRAEGTLRGSSAGIERSIEITQETMAIPSASMTAGIARVTEVALKAAAVEAVQG